jgi:hypothetical protein
LGEDGDEPIRRDRRDGIQAVRDDMGAVGTGIRVRKGVRQLGWVFLKRGSADTLRERRVWRTLSKAALHTALQMGLWAGG